VMNEGEFAARLGLAGVPTTAETIMLERDMRLVALAESRYHAASLTCAAALDVLAHAKEQGLKVTASASINHLTLNELDIGPYRTFLKVSPPLRAETDRAALVVALASGLIDVVMSDHNPQDVEGKRLPFAEASAGAIGLETMLTAGLRLVHSGELPLMTLLKAMSSTPAKILGLAGGTLRQGSPADVIVLDLDAPWVLDPLELKSKCKNTPFDEARLQGRVVRTIVAGRTVYEYV
jgi:dihydroorotase